MQKQLLQNLETIQHKIWKTKDVLMKKKEMHSKLNKGSFKKLIVIEQILRIKKSLH